MCSIRENLGRIDHYNRTHRAAWKRPSEMAGRRPLLSLLSYTPWLDVMHRSSRVLAQLLSGIAAQPLPDDRLREHNEQCARLPSLDGLRAISIIFVLIAHVLFTANFPMLSGAPRHWFDNLGNFGVRVFFVLSGFLITNLQMRG